tara:strand:+ start:1610 stop:2401 length:792 start_codon:yes stop_codon:yes gene_type:complete
MEYQLTTTTTTTMYSQFITTVLDKVTLSKNHTCNTEKELKFIFLKSFLNDCKQEKVNTDDTINCLLSFKQTLDQKTFDAFLQTILPNHFALFNEGSQEIETYLNIDHFLQSDFDLGIVVRLNTEDGIKDFINDDLDLIEMENRIIPFKICQKYGYILYDGYECELNQHGTELLIRSSNNSIKDAYYFDETVYGIIKKLKDSYFILNTENKWTKITIIPNSYGRQFGFSYYERIIIENDWDIKILVSPFEALNLKTTTLKNIFM